MHNYLTLLKAEIINSFGINKLKAKKGKLLTAFIILIGICAVYFCLYTYARMFAEILVIEDRLIDLFGMMTAFASILIMVTSVGSVSGNLFGAKDYVFLSTLPVKRGAIVTAKFTLVFILGIAIKLVATVIACIVYSQFQTGSAYLYASVIISSFFTPFLPIAIAMLLGTLIVFVTSRFKRKKVMQTVLAFGVCVFAFAFGFLSGSGQSFYFLLDIYFIYPVYKSALTQPLYLLLNFAINVGSVVLVTVPLALLYDRINSAVLSTKSGGKFKMKKQSLDGIIPRLYKMEVKRIFSTPVLAINGLFGELIGIVISVFFVVMFRPLLVSGEVPTLDFILVFAPALYFFTFGMTPMTSCTMSLEGKNFWILQTSPIYMTQVFSAKILVNITFATIPAFISSLVLGIGLYLSAVSVIFLTVIACCISTLTTATGLLLNLKFIKLNWVNEAQVVKSGLSMFLSMVLSFVCVAILGITAYFQTLPIEIFFIIVSGVLLLLNLLSYYLVYFKGEKILEKGLQTGQ